MMINTISLILAFCSVIITSGIKIGYKMYQKKKNCLDNLNEVKINKYLFMLSAYILSFSSILFYQTQYAGVVLDNALFSAGKMSALTPTLYLLLCQAPKKIGLVTYIKGLRPLINKILRRKASVNDVIDTINSFEVDKSKKDKEIENIIVNLSKKLTNPKAYNYIKNLINDIEKRD